MFVLGGSVVFNGLPLEDSIAGVLERRLRLLGYSDARVYNWGVVSYVSGQELALLLHRVVDLRPDLVVVLDGFNDFVSPYNYDPRPGYPLNFVTLEEGLDRVENQAPAYKLLATLLFKSKALRTAYAFGQPGLLVPLGDARDGARYRTPEWERNIVRIYLNNISKMADLSVGSRFAFAACLQPAMILKNHRVGREQGIASGQEFDRYLQRQYEKAQAGLLDLSRRNAAATGVGFFDLSRIFEDSQAELFWDPVHFTNQGNRIVADDIVGRLVTNHLLP